MSMSMKRVVRLYRRLRTRGVLDFLGFLYFRYCGRSVRWIFRAREHRKIQEILCQKKTRTPTIIIKSTLDYDFPYDQRPHHLARALARLGDHVFFVSPGAGYDQHATVTRKAENLFVTGQLEVLLDACPSVVLFVFSTDNDIDEVLLQKVWARGIVVYDFIDAIDDAISSAPFSKERLLLHSVLLEREQDVICLASAGSLITEIEERRTKNYALVENAVDMAHFNVSRNQLLLTPGFEAVINCKKPVAGYYGALADWLDYELLRETADLNPQINFVVMGLDFDGSVAVLERAPANLFVLPPVDYRLLPGHAIFFDVALVPFKLNHITMATSPLKLFEYMALGLPIVSTPIPEAKKYASVTVAQTADEFSAAIADALDFEKASVRKRLSLSDAAANDWRARAHTIRALIGSAMT